MFAFCKGPQTHCYAVEFESKKKLQLRFVASGVSCVVNRYLCGSEYVYDMYTRKIHTFDSQKSDNAAAVSDQDNEQQNQKSGKTAA